MITDIVGTIAAAGITMVLPIFLFFSSVGEAPPAKMPDRFDRRQNTIVDRVDGLKAQETRLACRACASCY